MTGGDGFEDEGETGEGIDGVHPAGLDEGGDAGPIRRPFVVTGEEAVLALEGRGPDRILDRVRVRLDPAIVEKDLEPLPGVGEVGEFLPLRDFVEILARALASQRPRSSTSGLDCVWRTDRLASGGRPAMAASMRWSSALRRRPSSAMGEASRSKTSRSLRRPCARQCARMSVPGGRASRSVLSAP
jgi:hypothetical protein